MHVLPDQPDLHFLKEEAKELLLTLKQDAPTTTLSQAQHTLANRYGFADWPALKTAVESRPQQPVLASRSLAEKIADEFALGSPVGAMTGVTYAYGGRTWMLPTTRGKFFVFPVFDWVDQAQATRSVELSRAAKAAGVSTPTAVADPQGQFVRRIAGQNWRVDEWMELGPTPQPPFRDTLAGQAGQILATIHVLNLPAPGPVGPWLTCRRPLQDWSDLARDVERAHAGWTDAFTAMLPAIEALTELPLDDSSGNPVLSICDLNPAGVRVGPRDQLTVVHWAYAGPQVPEWELAYLVHGWAMSHGDNPRAAKAILDGYQQVTGTAPKLEAPSFIYAICAHLNWVYNQARTAITAADPETKAYADRELRHLTATPLTVGRIQELLDAIT